MTARGDISYIGINYHVPRSWVWPGTTIMSLRGSPSPGPAVPNPETLILPDGPVGEQAAELLEEFIHASQHEEIDVDADYHLRRAYHKHLPWYRTPSPWWYGRVFQFSRRSQGPHLVSQATHRSTIHCGSDVSNPGT